MNRKMIDPSSELAAFRSLGRLKQKKLVLIIEDMTKVLWTQRVIASTHARGHLKNRRPLYVPSVIICTTQSSPCEHFGHSSLWLSYPLSGLSLVKSDLHSTGNSYTASPKNSEPIVGPSSHTIGGPFLRPFPLPRPKPFALEDPPDIFTWAELWFWSCIWSVACIYRQRRVSILWEEA